MRIKQPSYRLLKCKLGSSDSNLPSLLHDLVIWQFYKAKGAKKAAIWYTYSYYNIVKPKQELEVIVTETVTREDGNSNCQI